MHPSVAAARPWTTDDWDRHDALRALWFLRERVGNAPTCHVPSPQEGAHVLQALPMVLHALRDVLSFGSAWQTVPAPHGVFTDDGWTTYAYLDGTALVFRKEAPLPQVASPRFGVPRWPLCAPTYGHWQDAAFRQASRAAWEPALSWGVVGGHTVAQWAAPVPAWMRPFPARTATRGSNTSEVAPPEVRRSYNLRSLLLRHLLLGVLHPQDGDLPDALYLYGASGDGTHPTFFDHLSRPHLSDKATEALRALEPLCGRWLPGRFGFAQSWHDVPRDPASGTDPRVGTMLFDVVVRGPFAPVLSAHTRLHYAAILGDPEGFLALSAPEQQRLLPEAFKGHF